MRSVFDKKNDHFYSNYTRRIDCIEWNDVFTATLHDIFSLQKTRVNTKRLGPELPGCQPDYIGREAVTWLVYPSRKIKKSTTVFSW